MYRQNLFRFLFCAFAAFAIAVSASAQSQAGAIKAMRVQGDVVKLSANGKTSKVAEGSAVAETDTVITRKGGSAVLVFANGSSVRLAENSRLAIEEFKMDPTGAAIVVKNLQAEPTVSKTRLNLAYGEMVGNVKKLNTAAGSSFDVQTPVGAAGIRGTTFRIVLRFDAQGQATFSLATSEGLVEFNANGTVQMTGSGSSSVPAGTEVTATATVDPTTGKVTSISLEPTATISPAAANAINIVATAIAETAQQTVITVNEQQNSGNDAPAPVQTLVVQPVEIPENPRDPTTPI